MFPHIGMGELVLILAIVLLLFGAKRLPEVAKSVGKSLKSFRDGMNDHEKETPEDGKK